MKIIIDTTEKNIDVIPSEDDNGKTAEQLTFEITNGICSLLAGWAAEHISEHEGRLKYADYVRDHMIFGLKLADEVMREEQEGEE